MGEVPGPLVTAELLVPGCPVPTGGALPSIGWREPGVGAEPAASGEATRGKTGT